jgi:glutamate--cysteine ligase
MTTSSPPPPAWLCALHRAAERPVQDWLIGAEHELFCVDPSGRPPGYDGPNGIGAVLAALGPALDMQPTLENDTLIGLNGAMGSVTLEPGGQIELSAAPRHDATLVADDCARFHRALDALSPDLGLSFFAMGLRPCTPVAEVPLMPKARYAIMRSIMPTLGSRSLEMMFGTATIQANIDYADEDDFSEKFGLAGRASPVVAALFANSPYQNGRATGQMSTRYGIWDDTATERSGRFAFMIDEPMTYSRYAEWAFAQQMFFVARPGGYLDMRAHSFRSALAAGLVERADWELHMSTVFPEVRLKNIIEMRSADGGTGDLVTALNALWMGLLYDRTARAELTQILGHWNFVKVEEAAAAATQFGLAGAVAGRPMAALADDLVAVARGGLERRGRGEACLLDVLLALLRSGKSQAEHCVARFGDDAASARDFVAGRLSTCPWV